MTGIKALNSIELASFTTISAGISVIFAIISAVILALIMVAAIPNGGGVAIYFIPTVIVGSFMSSIYYTFSDGLLYNLLAPKLKTIFIAFKDEKEIVKISTTETAIMVSIILTIQVMLLYLVSVLILPLLLSTMMQTLMYSGQQTVAYSIYQLLVVISQPVTIAIIIFGTLIISFVYVLLGTYIYNYLAQSGRGIVLDLSKENGYTVLNSIDGLKFAIAFAVIGGALSLITGIVMVVSGSPLTTAIGNLIGGLITGFVEAYLVAIFYNFLAPKLGKLKIELIDLKIN